MTNTKSMELIETPFRTGKVKDIKNKVNDNALDNINSSYIVWYLLKRHKFGLVTTWAVVITISYMFPPVWDILGSIAH